MLDVGDLQCAKWHTSPYVTPCAIYMHKRDRGNCAIATASWSHGVCRTFARGVLRHWPPCPYCVFAVVWHYSAEDCILLLENKVQKRKTMMTSWFVQSAVFAQLDFLTQCEPGCSFEKKYFCSILREEWIADILVNSCKKCVVLFFPLILTSCPDPKSILQKKYYTSMVGIPRQVGSILSHFGMCIF